MRQTAVLENRSSVFRLRAEQTDRTSCNNGETQRRQRETNLDIARPPTGNYLNEMSAPAQDIVESECRQNCVDYSAVNNPGKGWSGISRRAPCPLARFVGCLRGGDGHLIVVDVFVDPMPRARLAP